MKQKVAARQLLANAQGVGSVAMKMEQLHQKPPSSPRQGGCHLCDKSQRWDRKRLLEETSCNSPQTYRRPQHRAA